METKPNIFEYSHYRDFLRDIYSHFKIISGGVFSFRSFAKKARMSSPNYLKMVMDGQRELSTKTIQKFGMALNLNKTELSFFEALVFYNKSKTDTEKEFYYNRLKKFKKFKIAQNISVDEHAYFGKWYVPVIREMILLRQFKEDPEWIARHLDPPISAFEAKEALEVLFNLGFVVRNVRGKLEQKEATIATSTHESSESLWNFHREMLNKATQALRKPLEERNISGMTLAVSKKQFDEISKLIDNFFAQLPDNISEGQDGTDIVCQINFQQFRLNK